MDLNTNAIKVGSAVMAVLIAALSALAGTGVLSAAAAGIVGGVLVVLQAAAGYLANRSVKRQVAASKVAPIKAMTWANPL